MWKTFKGETVTEDTIKHQHASNIYWYEKIFNHRINDKIVLIIGTKFEGVILPYVPHPDSTNEINLLKTCNTLGIIINNNKIYLDGIEIGHLPLPKIDEKLKMDTLKFIANYKFDNNVPKSIIDVHGTVDNLNSYLNNLIVTGYVYIETKDDKPKVKFSNKCNKYLNKIKLKNKLAFEKYLQGYDEIKSKPKLWDEF